MENKNNFNGGENLDDKNKKIADLLDSTSKDTEETSTTKRDTKERKVKIDISSLLNKASSSSSGLGSLFSSFAHNKKAIISTAVLVVVFIGYYFYNAFIKPPKYDTLPAIKITTHNNVKNRITHKVVVNKKIKRANHTRIANTKSPNVKNRSTIPVPILQTGNSKSASTMNSMVKNNTKAIVEATKEQEQKLFDIFKIEPEEEYKIDRLIDLAQKQNKFLSVEVSILQKKKKIDSLLGALQKRKRSESLMQSKVNMLINEIANLKSQVNSEQSGKNGRKLSPNNPFPFSAVQSNSNYSDEINSLSVGIIYTYKNNRKIAVVSDNGRIFRVNVGDKVTKHYFVKNIRPDGIVVALSPKSRGVFIPLSFNVSKKQKSIKFGIVNRKQNSQGSVNNYSTYPTNEQQNSPVTPQPPVNMPNNNGNGGF